MRFLIENPNEGATAEIRNTVLSETVTDTLVRLQFNERTSPKPVTLRCEIPCRDIYAVWRPSVLFDTALNPSWNKQHTSSALASGAPFHSLIAQNGRNRFAIALSDAATPIEIRTGVREEDGMMECEIELFRRPVSPLTEYCVTVRTITADLPYDEVIGLVEAWWKKECGYPLAPIPDAAYEPVYSTWYSYHQNLDAEQLLAECREAVKYGMKTVIVDDGWQTDDNHRGYAYCGDWKPSASKFPDVRQFVDRVHKLGMKVMFWYSVPFVGEKSEAYARFQGMSLGVDGKDGEGNQWICMDPRFPEVRDYVSGIYRDAMKNWGLDGFKLDFIDSFRLRPDTPAFDARWDTTSLEEGIDRLLLQITDTLRAINPDVLIEFRQNYIGPVIRKYGNLFRAADCPLDMMRNRIATVQLRYLMGKAPVHSDMLMWNPEEPAQAVARQLLSCLFAVPQISVRLEELSEEHRAVLKTFLDFCRANRALLYGETPKAEHPEAQFSSVRVDRDGLTVGVMYYPIPFRLDANARKTCVFNCTAGDTICFDRGDIIGERALRVYDCKGKYHSGGRFTGKQLLCTVRVPDGGRVEID